MSITVLSPASSVSTTPNVVTQDARARKNYTYRLSIAGQEIHQTGWSRLLETIKVDQEFPDQDRLEVVFHNTGAMSLVDAALVAPGHIVNVKMGWRETELVDLGDFITTVPQFEYFPDGSGSRVRMHAVSETAHLLRRGGVQKVWSDRRDSEIAKEIAKKYKFSADVQDTDPEFESVVQAGSTDLDFLKSRARLYGYLVYVRSGVLHFHEYRPVDNKDTLSLAVPGFNIYNVKISVSPFRKFPKTKKSQVDVRDLRIHDIESQDLDDKLAQKSFMGAKWPVAKAIVLANKGVLSQATEFVVNEGHRQDYPEIQRQVDKFQEASGWGIVHVRGKAIGAEFLRAGETVDLSVLKTDRFSGKFLCSKVCHTITTDYSYGNVGFQTEFELRRSFHESKDEIMTFLQGLVSMLTNMTAMTSSMLSSSASAGAFVKPEVNNVLDTGVIVELVP